MNAIADATQAQVAAADPMASTWVSANAGSGKTRVLTDRVARLLLHGNDPQRILCLTYTTAAAGEMQNRLFKRLGQWAMMPTPDLRKALIDLGEDRDFLTTDKLREARTLFASALETPGGLKIQTIHAFCDALLRRFPLEAGVTPSFGQLDDRQAKTLQSEVLQEIAEGSDVSSLQDFARLFSGFDIHQQVSDIAGNRDAFGGNVSAQEFGLIEGRTMAGLCAEVFGEDARQMLSGLVPLLIESGGNNARDGLKLQSALEATAPNECLRALESACLFGSGARKNEAKIGSFPTKPFQKARPELTERLNSLMQAVADARVIRTRILAYNNSRVLHDFSNAFLHRYEDRKMQLGLLDFDDLIDKALALLTDPKVAQWVLFKLDGGIDHVLVDEAQDTSPKQWQLITRLVEEFSAGTSARQALRTVFAVGDEKQSIYSFQGADPREFARMREHFQKEFIEAGLSFAERALSHSFRSAEPVLRLVDNIFDGNPVASFDGGCSHAASDLGKPGRVDLWPVVEDTRDPQEVPWYMPVNSGQSDDPINRLAANIATWIKQTVADGHPVLDDGKLRPATFGDFLILVRGRKERSKVSLFQSIIKQLKVQGVPIAGQDRLDIAAELAVLDVISVLKFAVTDQDDLSLAEALRSPLIGLSEADLFRLAHGRKGSLWNSLLAHKDDYPQAMELLSDMLQRADFERPFELIERILIRHGGRRKLLARLGYEAEEAIDQLLSEALRYETVEAPTLTGFLDWFENGDIVVKRQLEGGENLVRIMTVHGAKGLEAPVVILPDTLDQTPNDQSKLFELPSGAMAWKSGASDASDAEETAKEAKRIREAEEALRLLYVALTRAETRLVVCGAGKPPQKPETWYNLVREGLIKAGAVTCDFGPNGEGLSLRNEHWVDHVDAPRRAAQDAEITKPDWAVAPAAAPVRPARPVSPSDLGGAKVMPGDEGLDSDLAMLRGTRIHSLLEHLPARDRADWQRLAQRLLTSGPEPAGDAEIADCLAEAEAVLTAPALADIFRPDDLTEVAVTAPLEALGGRVIDGIIDRLIVLPDRIIAVDYKTNAVVPETVAQVPDGLLRQMGAYVLALRQIYPDRRIEVGILWTKTATLMTLPHNIVIAACESSTIS
jgi:ATP-dependent helicase/nuclease subunit A